MSNNLWRLVIHNVFILLRNWGVLCCQVVAMIFVIALIARAPVSFGLTDYTSQFFSVAKFALIMCAVFLLGKEFSNNTYKYLFTGKYSVSSILLVKTLVMAVIGIAFWLMNYSILFTAALRARTTIPSAVVINSLIIYIVISILIGSFSNMVMIVSKKVSTSAMWTLLTFGLVQHMAPIFIIRAEMQSQPPLWLEVIKVSPIYIIFDWMEMVDFSTFQMALMTVYTVLFIAITYFELNRKDMTG